MSACQCEIDVAVLKVQRAIRRRRHLRTKRAEYERARTKGVDRGADALGGAGAKANPHRLARAALRARLAKGILETGADVPVIVSTGGRGGVRPATHRRGLAVAAVLPSGRLQGTEVEPPCCSVEYLEWCRHSVEAISDLMKRDWRSDLAEAETTATEGTATDGGSDSEAPGCSEIVPRTKLEPWHAECGSVAAANGRAGVAEEEDAALCDVQAETTTGGSAIADGGSSSEETSSPNIVAQDGPKFGNTASSGAGVAGEQGEVLEEDAAEGSAQARVEEAGWEVLPCHIEEDDTDSPSWSLVA
mmetsp:Transcript_20075/g.55259  ORF Transcript_20075/g.55259 Transcript_20075/m.55259 type:complete len:303 (-) Transcript_20075:180-1088(-)